MGGLAMPYLRAPSLRHNATDAERKLWPVPLAEYIADHDHGEGVHGGTPTPRDKEEGLR